MRPWFALVLCACDYTPPDRELGGMDGPPADVDDGVLRVGFAVASSNHVESAGLVDVVVRLSRPTTETVTVGFGVGTGTARLGRDLDLAAGTLTFAGTDEQTIQVKINNNDQLETAETLELTLASPVGAELATASHVLTIDDDDTCFGAGAYAVCPDSAPTDPVTLPATLDTNGPLCAPQQPAGWTAANQLDACFIFGTTITVGSTRVTGTRPLVLAATDELRVDTLLDAASHVADETRGPGSPAPIGCAGFSATPATTTSGAPGGAGATYRSKGGNGGDGGGSNSDGRSNNPGAAPTVLRAGCDGQFGGTGDGAAGNPGRGGGVVYLVAETITIVGAINASGSGARATTNTKTGGSGGGSGGMIKLFAGQISATGAVLVANGGSGASGAGESTPGNPGVDPGLALPLVVAPGGPDTNAGGRGGNGSLALGNGENAPNNNVNNEGGGGGGGGAGVIESNLDVVVGAGATSPPVTIVP